MYLCESKQEPHGRQLLPVVSSAHERSKCPPDKTQSRQEDTRADTGKDHVCWDLKYEVRKEKH
jgi:hypothetical protein